MPLNLEKPEGHEVTVNMTEEFNTLKTTVVLPLGSTCTRDRGYCVVHTLGTMGVP